MKKKYYFLINIYLIYFRLRLYTVYNFSYTPTTLVVDVEDKLYLGGSEQKKFNTTDLPYIHTNVSTYLFIHQPACLSVVSLHVCLLNRPCASRFGVPHQQLQGPARKPDGFKLALI
jgi:hypothetical protein